MVNNTNESEFEQAAFRVINAVAPEMEEWDAYDDETCASIIVDQMDAHGDLSPYWKAGWDAMSYEEKFMAVADCR
jgi:hypothetical protein